MPFLADLHTFSSLIMLRATEFLVAIGAAVSASELLALHEALRNDGLLSWRVHRLTHPKISRLLAMLGLDRCFQHPGVLGFLAVRLLAGVLVAASICLRWPSRAEFYVLSATTLLFNLRCPEGNDGSDQMSLLILIAASLGELVHTSLSYRVVLFFIAAQSSLSYGTSGLLKVREQGWRNGRFVTEILATSSFGNRELMHRFRRHRPLRVTAGWLVAFGDCLLAFAAILPPLVCIPLLLFGVCMHLGIARILGLNTFLWAFVATYPAVLFVSLTLYKQF